MTKYARMEMELEQSTQILSDFEAAVQDTRFRVEAIQAALCEIASGDNPDEFARGQAAAYEDALIRLIRLLEDLDVAQETAAVELEE